MTQSTSSYESWSPQSGLPQTGDQADGLRRLFRGNAVRFMPIVANPHVAFSGLAIEQLAVMMVQLGHSTLVVDAADSAPLADEASALGLASCVQTLAPRLSYLAARGLPRRYVDTRGSAGRMLDEIAAADSRISAVLVHAEVTDLARLFKDRPARPILLAADQPDSVKHAYAAWKLLAQRCQWYSADLLLLASSDSPRTAHIAASLSQCADQFMGAVLSRWVDIDPMGDAEQLPVAALRELAASQLELDDAFVPATPSMRSKALPDASISSARH
jgi:hypothetical protein